jgi:hypothetical protein
MAGSGRNGRLGAGGETALAGRLLPVVKHMIPDGTAEATGAAVD